jgi:tetratricopeptide (TPR) repeat protein
VEDILHQAERLEKEYDWVGAAESYEKALKLLPPDDFSKRGEVYELLAYALIRGAFETESSDEFEQRLHQAIASCEEARKLRRKSGEFTETARISHCTAIIAYANYWLATQASERTRLLDECWRMEKEALEVYEETANQIALGKACVELSEYLDDRLDLELDMQARERILNDALTFGERAIQIFSKAKVERELARAYCITGIHCYNAAMSLQLEKKRKECEKKAFDYTEKTIRISESTGDELLRSRAAVWLGFAELDLGGGSEKASKLFEDALHHSAQVKDHRILAEIFDGLAYSVGWSMALEEDIEKIREKSGKCEEYASKAIGHSLLVNYGRGIPHSYLARVTNFIELAERETEPENKYELDIHVVSLGRQALEKALAEGSTHAILHISHSLADAVHYFSNFKIGPEKRQSLEEAMALREKYVYYADKLRPRFMYVRSGSYAALAMTLLEVSKLEESEEKRRELLEKSVSHMETGIKLIEEHVASFPVRRELFAGVGRDYTRLGNILDQLFQTKDEKEILRKLIEAHRNAAEMYSKAGLSSRVAEAYWQVAVAHNHLGEYLQSAANFESASKQYELSASNIPQLNLFYMHYAIYMQAWSEIENGRHDHERQEFFSAKEHFEKAAELHRSLKEWCYLASNYAAWAQIENAEDLSRKERSEEALQAFKEAAKLFGETKRSIQAQLANIESLDEKQMVVDMAKTTDTRREYCAARIALEEARILDRKGDHYLASQEYGSATEAFGRIEQASELDRERKEIGFVKRLSQAWQKMMLADAKASPELYLEASELFEQASKGSYNEAAGLQALGHSRFCRALEAGTRFADTRDRTMHTKAVQFLESAANYYEKAGFQKASEYVKATGLLFDAYVSMDNAKKEDDPEKKAKLYIIAEKVLQTAAGSFMKAERPEKREQVLRLLDRVKEERELAVSITEVLHVPSMVSATTSFRAPTSTSEEAVGSERFEHADVQANLIVRQKELKIGENLGIELELVNAGKGSALLTKVTEIVPNGFELAEKSENCRVEDSYINLKGKRLDPLKTEEVKLVLKPTLQGTFSLKPTVLYLDEKGKYKSHEPEPVTITVKELGIKGWLKGEK